MELNKYDFVVMIDKSGSMSTADCPGGKTRWAHAQEQTEALARKCAEFDDDGIDVHVFAGSVKSYTGTTPEKVSQIFKENEPSGSTETGAALKFVLDAYFARKAAKGGAKPMIVLCVTDGEPNSRQEVENVIIDATKRIDSDEELGISFIQIGKDAGARAFLKHLDDELVGKGAKYDIVDCKNDEEMESTTITDVLTQAITD